MDEETAYGVPVCDAPNSRDVRERVLVEESRGEHGQESECGPEQEPSQLPSFCEYGNLVAPVYRSIFHILSPRFLSGLSLVFFYRCPVGRSIFFVERFR